MTRRPTFSRALLLVLLLPAMACAKSEAARAGGGGEQATAAAAPAPTGAASLLSSTDVTQRRVIRTAELTLEADSPSAVEASLATLAASSGGFVVSSDMSQWRGEDGEESTSTNVVFRVPSAAFDATLQAVRRLGRRSSNEKITGQDVTEEYVDLEARIRAERAVEEQYLSILKEAKSIHDTLEVQDKLGQIRTEIERGEGRRRFLADQTSLSTLTVHVARHVAAAEETGPGFGRSLRKAGQDAEAEAIAIVNGAIRLVGVLLPIGLLLGLPLALALRLLFRRRRAGAA